MTEQSFVSLLAAIHQLPSMTGTYLRKILQHRLLERWNSITVHDLLDCGIPVDRVPTLMIEIAGLPAEPRIPWIETGQVHVITESHAVYPPLLRQIPSPPPVLYIRGSIEALHVPAIAVVGTRQASAYGLAAVRTLLPPVARQGISIVSGLALGIDAAAHRVALEHQGITVAVLGSGVDMIYPWPHRDLAQQIITVSGAVISEFPLGAGPMRHHFPQRNRIISGLCRATLVVEAGEKSGALVTAKFTLDQNRELLAVPGPITSPTSIGPNNWLRLGARLAARPEDILELFGAVALPTPPAPAIPTGQTPTEQLLINLLVAGPRHIDELAEESRLDTSVVAAALSLLEIRGHISHLGAMMYTIAS